jgi:DNA-binding IscR family transcriptional regulator
MEEIKRKHFRDAPAFPPRPPEPEKGIEEWALKVATFIHERTRPINADNLRARFGVGTVKMQVIMSFARQRGFVGVKYGQNGGYIAGPVKPQAGTPPARRKKREPAEIALDVAWLVRDSAATPLKSSAVRDALKVSGRTLSRANALAVEEGWVESKMGKNGGLIPGAVEPPALPAQQAAA